MLGKTTVCIVNKNFSLLIRNLTSTEVSTALRPFYFSVHPDLFGQHPTERAVNETSLQQLSSVLQSLQAFKYLAPTTLPFYLKNRTQRNDTIRLIKVYLKGRDIGTAIVDILKACDLPTSHVQHYIKTSEEVEARIRTENIQKQGDEWVGVKYQHEYDFTKDDNHPFYATFRMQHKMKEAKDNLRLKNWLELNCKDALEKFRSGKSSKEEIEKLKQEMIVNSKLKDIRWECGWNTQHFRGKLKIHLINAHVNLKILGCLLALKSLIEQHPQHMKNLEGQILVFSYFTGISLDGHLMLFSGEVRHNWLDFIKNITKHKLALGRVPYYEKSLSHVLRNIKVCRRKFMPDMKVGEYEINLKKLTTSVSDFFGRNRYPKSWPKTLENYEIVVETEAGPMMVSPTGQFIVPSSLPGPILISFITSNLEKAYQLSESYKHDKVMERALHKKCLHEFQLVELLKDDNITPELMIRFCQKLLKSKSALKEFTKDLSINVSSYYSVLSDGVVCVPWNFED